MKNTFVSFSVLLFITLISIGCNKESSKDVATKWLTSFYHLDYETTRKFSTEQTKVMIATYLQFTYMLPAVSRKEMKKLNITVKDVKEDGDKAVATYIISDSPDKVQYLNLVKQDGKWLVQFSKNDQMNGASAGAPSAEPPAPQDTSAAPAADTMTDSSMH